MIGRPTIYSEELADRICDAISSGLSIRAFLRDESFPAMSTIFKWLQEKPAFSEQYRIAREIQAEVLADELIEIADDGTNDYVEVQRKNGVVVLGDHEHIQRSKLRVETRMWTAAKLLPKKYGDKIQQELSGKDGGPLVIISTVPRPER